MYAEMDQWEKERHERWKNQEQIYRQWIRCEQSVRFFLEEMPGFVYDPTGKLTSRELYALYEAWCIREHLPVKPQREVLLYAKKHAGKYHLIHSTHIPDGNGKRVRGFCGIRRAAGTHSA